MQTKFNLSAINRNNIWTNLDLFNQVLVSMFYHFSNWTRCRPAFVSVRATSSCVWEIMQTTSLHHSLGTCIGYLSWILYSAKHTVNGHHQHQACRPRPPARLDSPFVAELQLPSTELHHETRSKIGAPAARAGDAKNLKASKFYSTELWGGEKWQSF